MSKFDIIEQPGDGFMIQINSKTFEWDVCYPSGRHERGKADTLERAEADIAALRTEYIMNMWERGRPHYGQWACPLT